VHALERLRARGNEDGDRRVGACEVRLDNGRRITETPHNHRHPRRQHPNEVKVTVGCGLGLERGFGDTDGRVPYGLTRARVEDHTDHLAAVQRTLLDLLPDCAP
jgi:hypothetical protein